MLLWWLFSLLLMLFSMSLLLLCWHSGTAVCPTSHFVVVVVVLSFITFVGEEQADVIKADIKLNK